MGDLLLKFKQLLKVSQSKTECEKGSHQLHLRKPLLIVIDADGLVTVKL